MLFYPALRFDDGLLQGYGISQDVPIKAGQGALAKGTLLMKDEDDLMVVADSIIGQTLRVLYEAVDTTEEQKTAMTLVWGCIKKDLLIVPETIDLNSAVAICGLAEKGIFLS